MEKPRRRFPPRRIRSRPLPRHGAETQDWRHECGPQKLLRLGTFDAERSVAACRGSACSPAFGSTASGFNQPVYHSSVGLFHLATRRTSSRIIFAPNPSGNGHMLPPAARAAWSSRA